MKPEVVSYTSNFIPPLKKEVSTFPLLSTAFDINDVFNNAEYVIVALIKHKPVGYILPRPQVDNLPPDIQYLEVLP